MERKIFELIKTKDYRRNITVNIKGTEGKFERRNLTFTTEHKINEKERNKNARKIPAEYSTTDEVIYDALLRDTSYGKTFVLKGDTEAKLKREPWDMTPVDAKKAALHNMFTMAGLEFDHTKSTEVLQEEYNIYMIATTGKKIGKSTASSIPHKEVDVQKEITEQVETARIAYKNKYGEDVPESFANDKAFLSALSNPDFDAKAYMEKASAQVKETPKDTEPTIDDLQKKYFDIKGKNPPNPKKNDAAWLKQEIAKG